MKFHRESRSLIGVHCFKDDTYKLYVTDRGQRVLVWQHYSLGRNVELMEQWDISEEEWQELKRRNSDEAQEL